MPTKDLWHRNLLFLTAIGISMVTISSLINPKMGNRSIANFIFPQEIPLPLGKYLRSQKIDTSQLNISKNKGQEIILAANNYQYQYQNIPLDIYMYYVSDTRGNIESLLKAQYQIEPRILKKQDVRESASGYFSFLTYREHNYLYSCLNPSGKTTINHLQFSRNLDRTKIDFKLILDWLIGKKSIRDRRCLWIIIAIPNNGSLTDSQKVLTQLWSHLLQWWQPRFPSL